MRGTGTTDAIFGVRQLIEKHREKKNSPLHIAFLDLEKAFDRIPHRLIWYSLREHGTPEHLIKLVQTLYQNTTSQARCAAGISKSFNIKVGVHQGSALSPLLFITVIDTITRDLQRPTPWCVLYADDIMLAATTRRYLQLWTQRWHERLSRFGLKLNINKTEYLETIPQEGSIEINGIELKKVPAFKYLGSILTPDGSADDDCTHRTNTAWKRWSELTGVLCDRKMPVRLKSKIYKAAVRPVALYGAECWPTTKAMEAKLNVMEMNMLRWSLGVTRCDRIRNDTIRTVMGVAAITEKAQESRLRWYGHVMRANRTSTAGAANYFSVDGPRPRGAPKKRWRDNIQADMQALNLNDTDTTDRVYWRQSIRKADPSAQGPTLRR